MHRERQPDEIRGDHRTARPGLDRLLHALASRTLHLLGEVMVDERTLLDGTRHDSPCLLLRMAAAHDELLRALVITGLEALGLLTPRRHRMRVDRKSTRLNSSH